MRKAILPLLCLSLLAGTIAKAQISLTAGLGMSDYYGDLSAKIFDQPSMSGTLGFSYDFSSKFSWLTEFSFMQIKGFDSKSKRADLVARNLSFKSNIWNINTGVVYDILDITGDRIFTPYVFLGIGLMHFNPYTTDRFGKKQYLQPLGTEGQGIAGYPDPYKLTQLEIPIGLGLKYVLNDKFVLQLDLRYHYVDTDYLDDVSTDYLPLATLNAKNPNLHYLSYRADELPGGAPYPNKGSDIRGNPSNKDSYYTTQIKVAYRLKSRKLDINY